MLGFLVLKNYKIQFLAGPFDEISSEETIMSKKRSLPWLIWVINKMIILKNEAMKYSEHWEYNGSIKNRTNCIKSKKDPYLSYCIVTCKNQSKLLLKTLDNVDIYKTKSPMSLPKYNRYTYINNYFLSYHLMIKLLSLQ